MMLSLFLSLCLDDSDDEAAHGVRDLVASQVQGLAVLSVHKSSFQLLKELSRELSLVDRQGVQEDCLADAFCEGSPRVFAQRDPADLQKL